ncbi:aminodeoxychorismate synthase component I [Dokdonella sp.]|uniref:aminodeoxychorismate synthase component I n=2 Tax=Dokdonella sp. TaxID=2291710 RepID=UPI002B83A432|nr:aminodeoxychorismate synthase component I [Dokdonella sp.]HPN80087.1 aminodeoxychorismate synthase component I [Dokdonella sp.]
MSQSSWISRTFPGRRDLLALASCFPTRYPGLLESAVDGTPHARHDLLFGFPQEFISLDADRRVRDQAGRDRGSHFLEALDASWRAAQTTPDPDPDALPFHGGWLLYLGYELAAEIEPRLELPMRSTSMPVALAIRCPLAILVDHVADRTTVIVEHAFAHLLDQALSDLDLAQPLPLPDIMNARVSEDDAQRFLDGVARTHDYLRAGDVFQVNLSRRWQVSLQDTLPPAQIYAALRRANPSPFAGLLQWSDWAVASSSPERLVQVRGRCAQTRPIAGTRPRLADDDVDEKIRELIGHPKERAEHVMLIDLERNDLGRVCEPGSIEVDELMVVESYAHVHHIVSNVRGMLRSGTSPGQVIRAVFPGGTITGCPKVRCMQIIAELERVARGAYTGAFGYLDRNGNLDLNILIRTLSISGAEVEFRAGAGIVVDSDASTELAETRAKARGMLRAFGLDV